MSWLCVSFKGWWHPRARLAFHVWTCVCDVVMRHWDGRLIEWMWMSLVHNSGISNIEWSKSYKVNTFYVVFKLKPQKINQRAISRAINGKATKQSVNYSVVVLPFSFFLFFLILGDCYMLISFGLISFLLFFLSSITHNCTILSVFRWSRLNVYSLFGVFFIFVSIVTYLCCVWTLKVFQYRKSPDCRAAITNPHKPFGHAASTASSSNFTFLAACCQLEHKYVSNEYEGVNNRHSLLPCLPAWFGRTMIFNSSCHRRFALKKGNFNNVRHLLLSASVKGCSTALGRMHAPFSSTTCDGRGPSQIMGDV